MQEIFNKLDLEDYITSFQTLFARHKEIILEGDINLHYKLIKELERCGFRVHHINAPHKPDKGQRSAPYV